MSRRQRITYRFLCFQWLLRWSWTLFTVQLLLVLHCPRYDKYKYCDTWDVITRFIIKSSSCWSSARLCKFMSSSSNSAFCKFILSWTFSLISWLSTSSQESSSSANFSFSGVRALNWVSLSASSLLNCVTSTCIQDLIFRKIDWRKDLIVNTEGESQNALQLIST